MPGKGKEPLAGERHDNAQDGGRLNDVKVKEEQLDEKENHIGKWLTHPSP